MLNLKKERYHKYKTWHSVYLLAGALEDLKKCKDSSQTEWQGHI